MFAIMKVTQGIVNARAYDEFALTARQALELATIEGARSLGMAGETGSLTPGKRATSSSWRPGARISACSPTPAHMLVTAAQPANVDTVIVKRPRPEARRRYVTLDAAQISVEAQTALDGNPGACDGLTQAATAP